MWNFISRTDGGGGTYTSLVCVLKRSGVACGTVRGSTDRDAGQLWRQRRKLMSLIKMNQSKRFRGNSHGRATNKLAARSGNTGPPRSEAGTNITNFKHTLNAWTHSTLFLHAIHSQTRSGNKLANGNKMSGRTDQLLWLLRWGGPVSDQICFLVWKNSHRLYVTEQLCVVAMASISDTLLQRLHDLGGTVTSESNTLTHTRGTNTHHSWGIFEKGELCLVSFGTFSTLLFCATSSSSPDCLWGKRGCHNLIAQSKTALHPTVI